MYIVPNMFANVQHTMGHAHTISHAYMMNETHLSRCRYLHRVEDKMLTETRCLLYHKHSTLFLLLFLFLLLLFLLYIFKLVSLVVQLLVRCVLGAAVALLILRIRRHCFNKNYNFEKREIHRFPCMRSYFQLAM